MYKVLFINLFILSSVQLISSMPKKLNKKTAVETEIVDKDYVYYPCEFCIKEGRPKLLLTDTGLYSHCQATHKQTIRNIKDRGILLDDSQPSGHYFCKRCDPDLKKNLTFKKIFELHIKLAHLQPVSIKPAIKEKRLF